MALSKDKKGKDLKILAGALGGCKIGLIQA
jgi:hypothetical protein